MALNLKKNLIQLFGLSRDQIDQIVINETKLDKCRLPSFPSTSFSSISDISTFVYANIHSHEKIGFRQAPFYIRDCIEAFPELTAKSSELGDGFRGWLASQGYSKKSEKKQHKVHFSIAEPLYDQRIIIAHELGHHFLENQKQYWGDKGGFYPLHKQNFSEEEIDCFAAELLAPLHFIQSIIEDKYDQNIRAEDLGIFLGITTELASKRLADLEYVTHMGLRRRLYCGLGTFKFPDYVDIVSWKSMHTFICPKCPYGKKPLKYVNPLKQIDRILNYDKQVPNNHFCANCFNSFRSKEDEETWLIPKERMDTAWDPSRALDIAHEIDKGRMLRDSDILGLEIEQFCISTIDEIFFKLKISDLYTRFNIDDHSLDLTASYLEVLLKKWAQFRIQLYLDRRAQMQQRLREEGAIDFKDDSYYDLLEPLADAFLLTNSSQGKFKDFLINVITKEIREKFNLPTKDDELEVKRKKILIMQEKILNEIGDPELAEEFNQMSKILSDKWLNEIKMSED